MNRRSRRDFLAQVGKGMLVAGVGSSVALDLGLAKPVTAREEKDRLTFGPIEPLVDLMAQTPIDRFLTVVVQKMNEGTELRELVSAAALANARAFGGQDYDGYHAIMALAPALQMSRELADSRRALPVLKVLYRNTDHIQRSGGGSRETLHAIEIDSPSSESRPDARALRAAIRGQNMDEAERTFAAIARGPLPDAFNELQYAVQDHVNVHRVVLAWRSWVLLDITGKEYAHTLLRQSVRYCVDEEKAIRRNGGDDPLRSILPRLLDRKGVLSGAAEERVPDDAWIDRMSHIVYASTREQAAEAVADALADGISHEAIGEAISLAANQLVLHDPGRRRDDSPAKPKGSVHGASVGVHASDASNAWRNISRVSDRRNSVASLIVGAYHTAGQAEGQNPQPYPFAEHRESVIGLKPESLLREAEVAIKANEQTRACAIIHRYGELDLPPRPAFDLMLRYAISEDGALHAEKYYRTVVEEFATTRPAYKWRHLAALARVTASEHGFPAPGVDEATRLLKL
jgi:hypothetical protein